MSVNAREGFRRIARAAQVAYLVIASCVLVWTIWMNSLLPRQTYTVQASWGGYESVEGYTVEAARVTASQSRKASEGPAEDWNHRKTDEPNRYNVEIGIREAIPQAIGFALFYVLMTILYRGGRWIVRGFSGSSPT